MSTSFNRLIATGIAISAPSCPTFTIAFVDCARISKRRVLDTEGEQWRFLRSAVTGKGVHLYG